MVNYRSYILVMKSFIISICLVVSLTGSALAQESSEDAPSLMERGAQMLLEGLLEEVKPTIGDLRGLAEELEPFLEEFALEMGPAFAELLEQIDDLSNYHVPEILPNGDIIIRRKTPLESETEEGDEVEI